MWDFRDYEGKGFWKRKNGFWNYECGFEERNGDGGNIFDKKQIDFYEVGKK